MKTPTLLHTLGYLGLVPFVALPLLGEVGVLGPHRAMMLFQLYSALILGFMAGVLWPVLHRSREASGQALLAVAFPIASFVGMAAMPDRFLTLQAALFLGLRVYEYVAGIDRRYPRGYAALRWQLTGVVVLMHLLYELFY